MAPALLQEVAPARPAQGDRPAVGPTYTAAYAPDGPKHLPGVETCYDIFAKSAEREPDRPCLAYRETVDGVLQPYKHLTYTQCAEKAAQVGSAYTALGLTAGDRVGICGGNSPEWMLSMQGCNRMSMCAVPIYDTLGENVIEYIVNHSETKVVMSQGAKLPSLAKALPEFDHDLVGVGYWGTAPEDAIKKIRDAGVKVYSWDEMLQLGADKPSDPIAPKSDDLCTIMYTSGTTGVPKGVMHSHGAVQSAVAALLTYFDHTNMKVGHNDSYFSFLTLAHIFDRVVEEAVLAIGGCIGYYSGDLHKLMEDVGQFKPTVFAGVPRIYERVYTGVFEKAKKAGPIALIVLKAALVYKSFWLRLGFSSERASPLADRLVFNKIKQALGGRVRVIASGAAPLPRYLEDFLKASMGAPVIQGYGLTETCAATFLSDFNDPSQGGTVGVPVAGVKFRLEAVAEMGYDPIGQPPTGEVCVRGPCLFKGYYKQDDLTKKEMDEDGFFHTGDVGEVTKKGALRIIDRKKNMFKLSQGEYVAVEKIESALSRSDVVEQLWVYGKGEESQLVAVVVPVKKALLEWAKTAGVGGDMTDVVKSPGAAAFVLQSLNATGKSAKLKGFEFPKAVFLEPNAFSVENDLMTPKFSLKRPNLTKHYKKQIDAMYNQLKRQAAAPKASSSTTPAPAGATRQ